MLLQSVTSQKNKQFSNLKKKRIVKVTRTSSRAAILLFILQSALFGLQVNAALFFLSRK